MTSESTTIRPSGHNLGTYSNLVEDATLKSILAQAGEMNFVDKAAHPHIGSMEEEVVQFLLDNLHAPPEATGFTTTGSSEAIILALASHQCNFIESNRGDTDGKLNFVISEAHHKAFEKYARLFGVELRPVALGSDLSVDIRAMQDSIDENTFCLVGIAGSTELGKVDDIAGIDKLAQQYNLPVHIDAAIGGYVLPFLGKQRVWDFALPNVQSMNISGHKYGLCLPGIGFLLVRASSVMPQDYRENSEIAYLSGGKAVDYALACSRSALFVVNAHYNLKQYGASGYAALTNQNKIVADHFARVLREISGVEDVIQGEAPVVNFAGQDILKLSGHLTNRGWIQNPHPVSALGQRYIRVVVRRHITPEILNTLLADIKDFYA